jgi:hypothetical protein
MPASGVSIGRRPATYVVLEAAPLGRTPCTIGVLLIDPETDRGWLRMRRDFEEIVDPEEAEVLAGLEDHIRDCLRESGAVAFLSSLADTLSNTVRMSDPETVSVHAFSRAVEQLYRENVAPVAVEFRTHVPLYSYSLRAAAGRLGEEMESAEEDWVPAPERVRVSEDLFVAHEVGKSMEPRIPDGRLNLFKLRPTGSRQGKILLIERFGVRDESARYTVKRYTSRKVETGEDEWRHEQIRLEPLNPDFEPWDVEPEGFAVVAEWLRVIE